MKWLYLVAVATIIVAMIIGLIIGKKWEKRLSQKQLEVRRNSFRYAFSALIVFEALLMVLHYFKVAIPFYWLTFGPIFVAGFSFVYFSYLGWNWCIADEEVVEI